MPAEAECDALLAGWGRTASTRATVVHATTRADVSNALTDPGPRGLIARGLGRAYGDAATNAGGRVLSLLDLDGVQSLDLERGEITVGGGMSLHRLMTILVPLGWFPSVVPGTAHVTVGGAIASDIHGKNHGDGSFCDHVVTIWLDTPQDGVVQIDAASPLFWATAGGMGLTGVVVAARLKLASIETSAMRVDVERGRDLDDLLARMDEGDHRYRYSVAWIDTLARGADLGRSVLTRGDHATRSDVPVDRIDGYREFRSPTLLEAPPVFPNGLLNPLSVRAFNQFWYAKNRPERARIESAGEFFFPLDLVANWNRVYGPRGFLQYQSVVPYGSEDVVRKSLEMLGAARMPSFFAVLKRFDRANPGLLSFPMPGWTLALDVPAGRPGLAELLDRLDEMVVEAGGRVYLAKDSRVRPELIPAMYPKLDEWRSRRREVDPDAVLVSDLDRRLDLTGRNA